MSQVSAVSAVSAVIPSRRNRGGRGAVLLEPTTISQWWRNWCDETVWGATTSNNSTSGRP
jgi:hypothetical protein